VNVRRAAATALWVFAALPPLAALGWALAYAIHAPEAAAWSSLWGEETGFRGTLDRIYAFEEGVPRLLFFRLACTGLLRIPGNDFGRFTWAGWILATAAFLAVTWLILRPGRRGDGWFRAAGVGLLGLWVFSPGFGATWILGERFRVFAPAVCFVFAVFLLTGERAGRLRFLTALLLAQVALFVDRSGLLVWIALIPLIPAFARHRSRPRAGLLTAVWCLVGNVSTAVCYPPPPAADAGGGLVHRLVTDPRDAIFRLLEAGASALPDAWPDTRLDQAGLGAALIALTLACLVLLLRRGRDREVLSRAAPWLSCILFGVGQTAILADRVIAGDLPRELSREFGWALVFFPAGLVGLGSVVAGRRLRAVSIGIGAIVGVILLLDWGSGITTLRARHATLLQGEAELVLYPVSNRTIMPRRGPPIPTPEAYRELRRAGFLRRSPPIESLAIAELPLASRMGSRDVGHLDSVETRSDGATVARGRMTWDGSGRGPDLVLLTQSTADGLETIFKIVRPVIRARSRTASWTEELMVAGIQPGDEIRAYGYAHLARRVIPLVGRFRRQKDERFVRVEESGP